jgi:signal transduction histidine kinase
MLRVLERMERLVRTSLQFGRPAAPRRAPHRPWSLCTAAISAVSPRTAPTGHAIRIECDPEFPEVYVDDGQIVQALVVLLDNALDATGSPLGVLVRVTRARPMGVDLRQPRKSSPAPGWPGIRFEVVDEGPGIVEAELSRIFDPFFTTKATGTGLGLSIAQQIVRENHGRLEVASARGGPTVFAIVVPVFGETAAPYE